MDFRLNPYLLATLKAPWLSALGELLEEAGRKEMRQGRKGKK